MSSLTSAISAAEQQINFNAQNTVNNVTSGVKTAVSNAVSATVGNVSGSVSSALNTGVTAAVTSVGSLLSGNFSNAASTLANAPGSIFSSALSGLGGGANGASTILSAPGTTGASSSDGGVIPGNNLNAINARADPMQSFMWYAQLPVISPGSTQSSSNITANSVINSLAASAFGAANGLSSSMGGSIATSSSAQLPWYYVEEASCPFRRYDTKPIFREGRDRHYPSKYSVDDLRLSIYADANNQAFQYLQAWNNAILTPFSATLSSTTGGGWGRPSDYKWPIYIYLLDPMNNVLAILEYTECWPVSIDQYSLDSGTSTRIVNHVNFSVGDVFVNLMGVTPEFTASILLNPLSNALSTGINALTTNFSSTVNSISSGASNLF
jgi:hypothetical protein